MRSTAERSAQNPLEKPCGDHPERIRQEISWIETTSKRQRSERRPPKRVQRGRVIELTRLDRKADRQRDEAPIANRRGGDEYGNPPRHHRGPSGIAEDVSSRRPENVSMPVHAQPEHDRAEGEQGVRKTRKGRRRITWKSVPSYLQLRSSRHIQWHSDDTPSCADVSCQTARRYVTRAFKNARTSASCLRSAGPCGRRSCHTLSGSGGSTAPSRYASINTGWM
jgi:hypothetical protein